MSPYSYKLLPLVLVTLIGCAKTPPLYPVVSGSYGSPVKSSDPTRIVLLGEGFVSPVVMSTVTETLQRLGQIIIEHARFQEVYNEQARQYTYGFDEKTIIRVGRLVGASHIVFVNTTQTYEYMFGCIACNRLTVTVRAVSVETGEVRWTGTAMTPVSVENEDTWWRALAAAAVLRGVCPTERGNRWDDSRGCVRR